MKWKATALILLGIVFLFIPIPPVATIIGLALILAGVLLLIK